MKKIKKKFIVILGAYILVLFSCKRECVTCHAVSPVDLSLQNSATECHKDKDEAMKQAMDKAAEGTTGTVIQCDI